MSEHLPYEDLFGFLIEEETKAHRDFVACFGLT